MKLKLLYIIPAILFLNGCVSYSSIVNSEVQENPKNKSKIHNLPIKIIETEPIKIIETEPIFNEVIEAFGIALGGTSSLSTLKSGIKFTPSNHPAYLNSFKYFVNDDNIIYKITALGEFLEYSYPPLFNSMYSGRSDERYFEPDKCIAKQNELVEILRATYENKAPVKGRYNPTRYVYFNPNALHKNKIIVTTCKSKNKTLVKGKAMREKFQQDSAMDGIVGINPLIYGDIYQYNTSFIVTYLNPKLAEEYRLKEEVKQKRKGALDINKKKKLRQLIAQEYGLVKPSNDTFKKPVGASIKQLPVVLTRVVGGKDIFIPTPKDWFEVSSEMPRLFKTFEKITLPPNRVLAAFLPIKDKKTPKLNRYTLVLVSKDVENMPDLPSSEFAWLKSQVKKKQGTLVKRFKEKYGDSWSLSDGPSSLKFKIGKVTPIGIFIDKKYAFAQATIMSTEATVGSKSSFRNVVVSAATLWVNGNMLNIQVTSTFKTKEDVDWIKAKTRELVNLILGAN